MELPDEVIEDIRKRLHRVSGQLAGIERMLDDGRECPSESQKLYQFRSSLFCGVAHGIVECTLVDPGLVERITSAAMRQCQFRGDPHIRFLDLRRTSPSRVRRGGPCDYEVRSHPVDVERRTQCRNSTKFGVVEFHLIEYQSRRNDVCGNVRVLVGIACGKSKGVTLVVQTPPHDVHSDVHVTRGSDLYGEPETIQQLWAELPLFGIHGSDEDELRGMRK